jgi:hypothetical protein
MDTKTELMTKNENVLVGITFARKTDKTVNAASMPPNAMDLLDKVFFIINLIIYD